jgi:hypothetical protein
VCEVRLQDILEFGGQYDPGGVEAVRLTRCVPID